LSLRPFSATCDQAPGHIPHRSLGASPRGSTGICAVASLQSAFVPHDDSERGPASSGVGDRRGTHLRCRAGTQKPGLPVAGLREGGSGWGKRRARAASLGAHRGYRAGRSGQKVRVTVDPAGTTEPGGGS
jgi:hypothetical protein